MMAKPKVVIIRGDWLSWRDTQYYAPLVGRYDLVGVSVRRTAHDLSLVQFPVTSPWSVDSVIARAHLQGALDRLTRLKSENLMYFFGLERICEGAAIIDFAETFHPFCAQAVRMKQRTGARLVSRVHENIPFAHSNLGYRRATKQLVFENADAFITCSKLSKTSLELEGAPAEKIHVIPMGTDIEHYHPVPKDEQLMHALGLTESGFVTLFVGRMTWEKGLMDVLNAAAVLAKAVPGYKLLLVGGGPYLERLPRLVSERGIEDVVCTIGQVPADEVKRYYSIADVVVVPSISVPTWQEQFGGVLIEAMACGKAMVVSDCGAIPEVVGDAAVVVPQANYLYIASAIRRFAEDRAMLADYGTRARSRAEQKFSNELVADQIDKLYRELLD